MAPDAIWKRDEATHDEIGNPYRFDGGYRAQLHRVYMTFLYCWVSRHLENICPEVPSRVAVHGAVEARRPGFSRPDAFPMEHTMDLILIAIGLGFFALSIGYAYACERL